MIAPRDKFEWIKVLGLDRRMSYADRYVLTMTAIRSARTSGLTFCVRQTTIAENCSATVSTVRRALAAGRQYGYIALEQKRIRGRGHHGADKYRLALPASQIGVTGEPINCSE